MTKPSVSAALKRLEAYVGREAPSDTMAPLDRDILAVCAALRLTADCAEYTYDADMEPIYAVRLPCDWRVASKGFLACLTASQGRSAEDVG